MVWSTFFHVCPFDRGGIYRQRCRPNICCFIGAQQESVSKGMVTSIIYFEQIIIHPSIDGFHIAPLFIHHSNGSRQSSEYHWEENQVFSFFLAVETTMSHLIMLFHKLICLTHTLTLTDPEPYIYNPQTTASTS